MKISKTGYKKNSKDKNEPELVIPSNRITMKNVEFPVYGTDNTGYSQVMLPGMDYVFPGNYVHEVPMAQNGYTIPGRYKNPEGNWVSVYSNGGDISIPNLSKATWLDKYDTGGPKKPSDVVRVSSPASHFSIGHTNNPNVIYFYDTATDNWTKFNEQQTANFKKANPGYFKAPAPTPAPAAKPVAKAAPAKKPVPAPVNKPKPQPVPIAKPTPTPAPKPAPAPAPKTTPVQSTSSERKMDPSYWDLSYKPEASVQESTRVASTPFMGKQMLAEQDVKAAKAADVPVAKAVEQRVKREQETKRLQEEEKIKKQQEQERLNQEIIDRLDIITPIQEQYEQMSSGLGRLMGAYVEEEDPQSIVPVSKVEEEIKPEDATKYGYKHLYTVPDTNHPSDSLVAFTNTFNNDEGARYYVGHKANEVTQGHAPGKFENARAVAHFLRDSDILPGQKITPASWGVGGKDYEMKSTSPGKALSGSGYNDPERYRMAYKPNPDGTYNVRYIKTKDLTPEITSQYEVDLPVSGQHKFSDIDWEGEGKKTGFAAWAKKTKYLPLKKGVEPMVSWPDKSATRIPYKDKNSFSRFSGGSIVYVFKDPTTGKQIGVDVSGSVNTMKKIGENLINAYKIKPEDLELVYHDMGSYSAKPKAHGTTLDYDQWLDYNQYNKGFSGAPLVIPAKKYGGWLEKYQEGKEVNKPLSFTQDPELGTVLPEVNIEAEKPDWARTAEYFAEHPPLPSGAITSVPFFEAALMAPTAFGAAGRLLATKIPGLGLSANNIINPYFAAKGVEEVINPQSDFKKAGSRFMENPLEEWRPFLGETLLASLNFAGATSLPKDMRAILKSNIVRKPASKLLKHISDKRKLTPELYVQHAENMNNALDKERMRIARELLSPEGSARLKNQFRLADPSATEQQLDHLANNRTREVLTALEKNMPSYYLEHGKGAPGTKTEGMEPEYFPFDNAYFTSNNPFIVRQTGQNLSSGLVSQNSKLRDEVVDIDAAKDLSFANPYYNPGTISIGTGYRNPVPVMRHEAGHATQGSGMGNLPLEKDLLELVKPKSIRDKIWFEYRALTDPRFKREYDYFTGKSNFTDRERYPFLVQNRASMKEKGILDNTYDKIDYAKLKQSAQSKKANRRSDDRLVNLFPSWKWNKLADIMNVAPSAVPYIATGTGLGIGLGLSNGSGEPRVVKAPTFKSGGWLNKYQLGNEVNCEDGNCIETDQIQAIYDQAQRIPGRVVDFERSVAEQLWTDSKTGKEKKFLTINSGNPSDDARNIWKQHGAPDHFPSPSCMYVAGLGWRCAPETKEYMSNFNPIPFNSNTAFINAVNKSALPFKRTTETDDPYFDTQQKGNLRPGDVVNFKGPDVSHAMTFIGYDDKGQSDWFHSNGMPNMVALENNLWEDLRNPAVKKYVNRFDEDRYVKEKYGDKIEQLEKQARENPTYYKNGGIKSSGEGYYDYINGYSGIFANGGRKGWLDNYK